MYKKDCDSCYIGETSKQVICRIEEHIKNVANEYTSSLIFQHTARKNHNMDWNNISVLNKHQNTFCRKLVEACHKLAAPSSFNRAITLPTTYTNIIHNTLIDP